MDTSDIFVGIVAVILVAALAFMLMHKPQKPQKPLGKTEDSEQGSQKRGPAACPCPSNCNYDTECSCSGYKLNGSCLCETNALSHCSINSSSHDCSLSKAEQESCCGSHGVYDSATNTCRCSAGWGGAQGICDTPIDIREGDCPTGYICGQGDVGFCNDKTTGHAYKSPTGTAMCCRNC